MKISELKTLAPYLMKTNITALNIGHHGLGKSATWRQIANENGMRYVDLRLGSTADIGDVIGLMHEFVDEETGSKRFGHSLPIWWPKTDDEKVLIHVDEINQAHPDILKGIFQLVLDYQVHTHKLNKKNVYVAASCNPDTDDYQVNTMTSKALLSRFVQIKFSPSQEEFMDYARSASFEPTFLGFVAESMKEVDSTGLKGFEIKAMPDRRAIERVSDLLKAGLPEELWMETIGGMIGYEMTVKYLQYFKNNRLKPLTGDQILKEYNKHSHMIAEMHAKDRHDTISVSVENVFAEVLGLKKITEKQAQNLRSFLLDVPRDISQGFVTRLVSESGKAQKEVIKVINDVVLDNEFIEKFSTVV